MVYAIYSQKGGTGKSTTAFNLACGLAEKGKRVLVIDLDQQANLSLMAGVSEVEKSLVDVFKGSPVGDAIVKRSGIDLISATDDVMDFEGSVDSLKKVTSKLKQYDYILLDCPP